MIIPLFIIIIILISHSYHSPQHKLSLFFIRIIILNINYPYFNSYPHSKRHLVLPPPLPLSSQGLGEVCGGTWDFSGICAKGLECDKDGEFSEGVCVKAARR